uniref:Putative secreted peptide n=1 Tax=Anopheles braziliensis TaxID=58242 RepID=A0A2M3ZX46_9DIPT
MVASSECCLLWPVLSWSPNGRVLVSASGCLRSAYASYRYFRWWKSPQNGVHCCCSPDCTVALHPGRRYLGTFPAPENYRCRRSHHLPGRGVRSLGTLRRLRYWCCV